MKSLLARFRRFVQDCRGAIAVPAAVAAPFFLVMVGMAVEYQHWEGIRSDYQDVADAAAYSIALDAAYGGGDSAIQATLQSLSARQDGKALPITYHWPPTTGPFAGRDGFIQAEVRSTAPRYLTKIMFSGDYDIAATAVASYSRNQANKEACIIALSAEADAALDVAGSAKLSLSSCLMLSNSLSDASLRVAGTASVLDVACISLSGGADISSGATIVSLLTDPLAAILFANIKLHDCTAIQTDQSQSDDPYAHFQPLAQRIVERTEASCVPAERVYNNKALPTPTSHNGSEPVTCLRNDVRLKGNVTLDPGIYVINGGELTFDANANIVGEGVSFILTNDAELKINGTADVKLSGPTSGSTQGMVFLTDGYNDGRSVEHLINGNANTQMDGVVYLPGDTVEVTGNATLSRSCIQVIADAVKVSGSLELQIGCLPSDRDPRSNGKVALVD
jgi:hypothetical protein